MKNKTSAVPIGSPEPTNIVKLEQLRALCDKPLECKFVIDETVVSVPLRRLPAAFEERIQALRREVQPPVIKGRSPEEERFNFADKGYLAAKDKVETVIRALTIYEGCPCVQEEKNGLTKQEDVLSYVQGLFPDHILNLLYLTIAGGGIKVWDRVNFTPPPDSAN